MKRSILLAVIMLTAACDSSLVNEAQRAERDGRVISNEMMTEMYPDTFRRGDPPYLERDFEAGADFICDELEKAQGRDPCAEHPINWRRATR